MTRTPRALASLLAALSIGFTASALAAPADEPNLKFTARVEPAELAPGGAGVVILDVKILPHVHVYDNKSFKVTPFAAKGVAYEAPVFSPSKSWKDPTDKEAEAVDVWFDKIEIRLPFKLAADAQPPLKVGADVKWAACNEDMCFPPEKTKAPILADVKAPAGWKPAEAIAPPPPPALPPGMVADPPGVKNPPSPRPAVDPFVVVFDIEKDAAKVTVRVTPAAVRVLFEPKDGYHLYTPGHDVPEQQIHVTGKANPAATWKTPVWPADTEDHEVNGAYEVVAAYERTSLLGDPPAIQVRWQGCSGENCASPQEHTVAFDDKKAWEAPPEAATAPPTAPAAGPLFEEKHETSGSGCATGTDAGDPLDDGGGTGLLPLLTAFVIGIGLAFTPCVLPIIPITISIIGGGGGDVTRGRLTLLLSCYVTGLALTFGTMGLLAARAGASFSAAFQIPGVIWGVSGIFFLLSLGMYGIYELQPPQWLQRLQGGAKGGKIVGAFLFGALAAVISSPCTGPAIAVMVLDTAREGHLVMGFLRFVSLGLGMGAVFFAAGSLNLVLRPGPWMVWVRHGFGVVITGAALFYVASSELLSPTGVFAAGFVAAALIGFGIAWHLRKAQGQELLPAASQGAKVAVGVCVVTLLVALWTRPAHALVWTNVHNRAEVLAEIEKAKQEGKPVVVDVWATWCGLCKKYDRMIEGDKDLLKKFRDLHRVRLDVTTDNLDDLRAALRIPNQQPYMVFIDRNGFQRSDIAVKDGHHEEKDLSRSADCVEKIPAK